MKDITIPGGKHAAKAQKMIQVFGVPDPDTKKNVSSEIAVNNAVHSANLAFATYSITPGHLKAELLETIAEEMLALGDTLIHKAQSETSLPAARLVAERNRTVFQLQLFGRLLREGSWVEAIIDPADPDRKPASKPDLRRMLYPIGPVVVFGAGNFPLAYSTAGGDTASALAAGCPVIVKAHEHHLGTHQLVVEAIHRALIKTGLPEGIFQSLIGDGYATGQMLVAHPGIKAGAFTGSLAGGRALYDIACKRPDPIPFFAEMGSVNPVFILPSALTTQGAEIGKQLVQSFTLHAGQYCTNPGLLIVRDGEGLETFKKTLIDSVQAKVAESMYASGVYEGFQNRLKEALSSRGIQTLAQGQEGGMLSPTPALAHISAVDFLKQPTLHHEIFGPFSLLIICTNDQEMLDVAGVLGGQLTASVFGLEEEAPNFGQLIQKLREQAGRLIWNAVPTGVEVSPAMQHGGPWPASTDVRFTSVGPAAIRRWVRPVSYQNVPDSLLPPELQRSNPLNIWRQVGNTWTKEIEN